MVHWGGWKERLSLCRSDRGHSDTSKILGLDDFLITIRDLLQVPDEQSKD